LRGFFRNTGRFVKLDGFIKLNDREILQTAGHVSAERAHKIAETEFERYEEQRRLRESTEPTSDFDHMLEEVKALPKGKQKKGDSV
jgi:hypothetical protein